MKNRVILFIPFLLFFVNAQGQNIKTDPALSVVDSFARSNLGIKNGRVDLNEYNQFKKLFDINAVVEDDYNAFYKYNGYNTPGSYEIKKIKKSFDVYAHNLALQISSVAVDSIGEILPGESNTADMKSYTVFRKITVTKARKYVLLNNEYVSGLINERIIIFEDNAQKIKAIDKVKSETLKSVNYTITSSATLTIFLKRTMENDYKITEVLAKVDAVTCINDDDLDAILNHEDSLKTIPGDFTSNGRPDYDLDGIPDKGKQGYPAGIVIDKCKEIFGIEKNQGCPIDYFISNKAFEGFVGLQFNSAQINLPELNRLGYSEVDVRQSKKGNIKNPGLVAGIFAGVNYAYYFGKKKKKTGISLGISYSSFTANFELTDKVVYTFKSNDGVDDYRRRVTINSLKERVKYNILNLPVLFSYRTYLGNNTDGKGKMLFNLKAGPSLMLFNTTSEYDAFISCEGLYQTDGSNIIYDDFFKEESTTNIFLTVDSINARSGSPGAAAVFKELNAANAGYDFADNINKRGKQKNESRLAVGLNLFIEMQKKIGENWAFKFGAHGVYAPLPERKAKYTSIDKTDDLFNPIYNSNAKSSFKAFGINTGLVYNF